MNRGLRPWKQYLHCLYYVVRSSWAFTTVAPIKSFEIDYTQRFSLFLLPLNVTPILDNLASLQKQLGRLPLSEQLMLPLSVSKPLQLWNCKIFNLLFKAYISPINTGTTVHVFASFCLQATILEHVFSILFEFQSHWCVYANLRAVLINGVWLKTTQMIHLFINFSELQEKWNQTVAALLIFRI